MKDLPWFLGILAGIVILTPYYAVRLLIRRAG